MATPSPAPSAAPAATTGTGPPPAASSGAGTPPAPSPGTLQGPDGKDISQQDTNSARRQRSDELATMQPAPPGNAVGFDIQPQHVYYASYMLRNAQFDFAGRVKGLVDALDGYAHAVGCGTGPEAFAKAYAEVAVLFLAVWNRATEGVGGAAVGLTVTANNYARAEHATNVLTPAAVTKNPPDVLKRTGVVGSVAELGWGNASTEDGWGNAVIDEVSGALSWVGDHVLRPIMKHALQHGKVADITPGGDDTALPKIADAWRQAGKDAKKSAEAFDDAIAYLTNPAPGNDEWQSAMKQFCSAIWGTTAWGRERHNHKWNHADGQQPALDVLQDTARDIATACDSVSSQVTRIRATITDVYKDAAKKTFEVKGVMDALEKTVELPELAAEFIANIDTGRLNHAVDSYNREFHGRADDLTKLREALEEAERSVPTYSSEEAHAEAFGARSLNEFKADHQYIRDADGQNHFYALDLASQEGIHGSHVIDKHVGKTDEQLAQRLRDQQLQRNGTVRPEAASTFTNLASAQRYTQEVMDDVDNAVKIENWLKRLDRQPNPNERSTLTLNLPFNEVTGRTVLRSEYDQKGLNVQGSDVHNVEVVLRYKRDLDPEFVVLTSMPAAP